MIEMSTYYCQCRVIDGLSSSGNFAEVVVLGFFVMNELNSQSLSALPLVGGKKKSDYVKLC